MFYKISENVKAKMYFAHVNEDEIIYSYQDFATCFFIVQTGSLELTGEDHHKKKILKPNDGI